MSIGIRAKKNSRHGPQQSNRPIRVVATNPEYARFCRQSITRLKRRVKQTISLATFRGWCDAQPAMRPGDRVLFISRLADISDDMAKKLKTAAGARYLLLAENLPIESLAPRLARLDIRDEHRLHLARKKYSHEVLELIHRLLRGIALPEQAPFIVDAWTEENNLVVLSPSFQRLTVPFAKLSAFLGDDPTRMSEFEIDEDGSFLHWGHADVHLGWEQLLHLVDPAAALLAKQRARDFNRHYGAAIRALREQRGIKQSEVAGLTDRHLRRIELGQQTVTKSALEALAAAHQMSTNVYMDALAKRIT